MLRKHPASHNAKFFGNYSQVLRASPRILSQVSAYQFKFCCLGPVSGYLWTCKGECCACCVPKQGLCPAFPFLDRPIPCPSCSPPSPPRPFHVPSSWDPSSSSSSSCFLIVRRAAGAGALQARGPCGVFRSASLQGASQCLVMHAKQSRGTLPPRAHFFFFSWVSWIRCWGFFSGTVDSVGVLVSNKAGSW